MADVEMQDAAADTALTKNKTSSKVAKGGAADTAGDSKKRFEVKKVRAQVFTRETLKLTKAVECRRSMGLGYCSRQLRHLPKPHHGPLHRMPGESRCCYDRRVHGGLGYLQSCFSLSLHLTVA